MKQPAVAQYKPYRVEVRAGKQYFWCSCGRSKRQPFCDNSHAGTSFLPLAYTAPESRAVLFCGCKHTAGPPLCDGSHNNLVDEYAEDERPMAELLEATVEVPFDAGGRAELDGGCFVQQPEKLLFRPLAGLQLASVIASGDGARFLAQSLARLAAGSSGILGCSGADVLLFCTAGEGVVSIAGRDFPIAPRAGVYVCRNEGFRLTTRSAGALECLLTVCPGTAELQELEAMPAHFDDGCSPRAEGFDAARRVSMADRFYQVLIGEENGSCEVTQFIGQIPRSKAAPHRHLYEEALVILGAAGVMWTETRRARVRPGDLIFLPAEQEHSLQCTDEGGMELAGHFYPAGSPSVNY
jgi:CDGSH-type Zn-finger protein/quercetin dioxygenase-like cupin family protein